MIDSFLVLFFRRCLRILSTNQVRWIHLTGCPGGHEDPGHKLNQDTQEITENVSPSLTISLTNNTQHNTIFMWSTRERLQNADWWGFSLRFRSHFGSCSDQTCTDSVQRCYLLQELFIFLKFDRTFPGLWRCLSRWHLFVWWKRVCVSVGSWNLWWFLWHRDGPADANGGRRLGVSGKPPFRWLPLERQRSLGLLSETLPSEACWRPFKPVCGVTLGSGRPLTHFYELWWFKGNCRTTFSHLSHQHYRLSLSTLCLCLSAPLSLSYK